MSILGNFQVLSRQPNVFAVSQNIEKCEKLNSLSADTLLPKKKLQSSRSCFRSSNKPESNMVGWLLCSD